MLSAPIRVNFDCTWQVQAKTQLWIKQRRTIFNLIEVFWQQITFCKRLKPQSNETPLPFVLHPKGQLASDRWEAKFLQSFPKWHHFILVDLGLVPKPFLDDHCLCSLPVLFYDGKELRHRFDAVIFLNFCIPHRLNSLQSNFLLVLEHSDCSLKANHHIDDVLCL